ncbi:enoyl-CoA hydratase [Sagittula sp. SSi028]|uniref:enoyl-CoA hydratase n=1 Tax=Sagittula sp. SSi028 TaxID=3400636 RepID=UPI003AF61117
MALLIRQDAKGIARLTLNSPANLNALSDEMLDALQSEIDALAADPAIRVVVLSGAGKAFCAGHDLKQMQAARGQTDKGRAYYADLFARCSRVMLGLQKLPQPVIAEVHGIATAAGCQLVASCDMAVAADNTRFGVNGVNIGLFCSTPMVALTRNIPCKKAFEMLTTGHFLTAAEAADLGLINRAVPASELANATQSLAETVAAKLSAAVKIGKSAFYEQLPMSAEDAYAFTGKVMVENMLWRDTDEGVSAFLEKRPPDWSDTD